MYQQIIELRNNTDAIKRGYQFEQIIREVLPWDIKPPIAYTTKTSEQLDAVFTWKGFTFIVESKAKKTRITPGTHDWEDFENKILHRNGNVIGLFCSLYDNLSQEIYEAAKFLNRKGNLNIVLDGKFWDNLAKSNIPLEYILEYMITHIKIYYVAIPPDLDSIKEWYFDKEKIENTMKNNAIKYSSSFLRRYKHKYHDSIYVKRRFDNEILSHINHFKPSSLKYNNNHKFNLEKQVIVIRDLSGTGKTTLSVQLSHNKNFIGISNTANSIEIDQEIFNFINEHNGNNIINMLDEINKPLVFIIDSLDEAKINIHSKKKEINALFRFLQELNKFAESIGYKQFPIVLVLTVREDYWRDWEYLFEDSQILKIKKRLSTYNNEEFKQALTKYSKTYNYNITNNISKETKQTLSQPINLEIFSESMEYKGDISIDHIWETEILYNYFERKKDDIFKHPIQNFCSKTFMILLSELSFFVIQNKQNIFSRGDFINTFNKIDNNLKKFSEDILVLLVSEFIIKKEIEQGEYYRFRHSKFIEYLCAYYISYTVSIENNTHHLDKLTEYMFNSGIVSMYLIHDNIRYICEKYFPEIKNKILQYYAQSENYMHRKLLFMRSNVAIGLQTNKKDVDLILKNVSSHSPEVAWNSFFVLSAKNNHQSTKNILDIFSVAWKSNKNRIDRWKILLKLSQYELLLNEKVILQMLDNGNYIEWERYLGLILEDDNQRRIFCIIVDEIDLKELTKKLDHLDWKQVKNLFDILINDREYITGQFND